MKRTILIIALVIGSFQTKASSDSLSMKYGRHWVTGLGFNLTTVWDEAMSPVRYGGASLRINPSLQKFTSKHWRTIEVSLGIGGIRSTYYEETERGKANNFGFNFDYRYLKHLTEFGKGAEVFLGGGVRMMNNARLHNQLDNSVLPFDSFTSLSLEGGLQKDFRWKKRDFLVRYSLGLPIMSLAMRPNYVSVYNFVNPESEFFNERIDEHGLSSFGSYFRVISKVELLYKLKTGNLMSLAYQWDYYSYNKVHQLNVATHSITFSRYFNY
ncbi:MAG: hypothetical protein AAGC88_02440 [Bacteroidota bacterium]